MRSTSFLLFLFFCSFTQAATELTSALTTEQITVSGTGYIEVEPDKVDLSIGLNALEETLQLAKKKVDKEYRKALSVLLDKKVEKKDIRLTVLSSRPEYEWQKNKRIYKGHRVSRNLKITINQVDDYPELLQSLVDAGISEINHISPGITDRESAQKSALEKAAINAKGKAKLLASTLNRTLGRAVQIKENGISMPHQPVYRKQARAEMAMADSQNAAPQAMFGSQRIQANVTVSFLLK